MGFKEDLKKIAEEAAATGGDADNIRELGIGLAEAYDRDVQETIDELSELVENLPKDSLESALKRHGMKAKMQSGGGADWISDAFRVKGTDHDGFFVTGEDGDFYLIHRVADMKKGSFVDDIKTEGSSPEEIVLKAKSHLKL